MIISLFLGFVFNKRGGGILQVLLPSMTVNPTVVDTTSVGRQALVFSSSYEEGVQMTSLYKSFKGSARPTIVVYLNYNFNGLP